MNRTRIAIFVVVCLLSVVGAGVVIARSGDRSETGTVNADGGAGVPPQGGPGKAVSAELAELRNRPHAAFVDTRVGPTFGKVALTDPTVPDRAPVTTDLVCERADFAADRGICLTADRGAVTTYRLQVLDRSFTVLFTRSLTGLPSRTRVSPDGNKGASTTFVSGDSYLSMGQFATRTEILDLRTGESFGELEKFAVEKDGKALAAVDFNFWGVTFSPTDSNRFYATLGTGGATYLVEGEVAAKKVKVVHDKVECPSVSPDGTRIAFKQRYNTELGRTGWHLAVLDLATMTETVLAETRSVDDQVFWLDNETVLYALPEADEGTPTKNTYAVQADGTGQPRVFVKGANSLSVTRS